MAEYTFKVGDATVTPIDRVTNRARMKFNRIRKLITAQRDDDSADFAYLTAYTKTANGGAWSPVSPDAGDAALLASYDAWLDYDARLNDEWFVGLFPAAANPVTSPEPPPEGADPNS